MYFVVKTPLGDFQSIVFEDVDFFNKLMAEVTSTVDSVAFTFKKVEEDGGHSVMHLNAALLSNSAFIFYE